MNTFPFSVLKHMVDLLVGLVVKRHMRFSFCFLYTAFLLVVAQSSAFVTDLVCRKGKNIWTTMLKAPIGQIRYRQ